MRPKSTFFGPIHCLCRSGKPLEVRAHIDFVWIAVRFMRCGECKLLHLVHRTNSIARDAATIAILSEYAGPRQLDHDAAVSGAVKRGEAEGRRTGLGVYEGFALRSALDNDGDSFL
jgi:hypothetical protein